MTTQEYIHAAIHAECDFEATQRWCAQSQSFDRRLAHATLGIVTETAELLAALCLKDVLDHVHFLDELGDIAWYAALGMDALTVQDFQRVPSGLGLAKTAARLSVAAGALCDTLKTAQFYGRTQSHAQAVVRLGEIWNLLHDLAEHADSNLSEVMERNLNKLKVRYPKSFTKFLAAHRHLAAEHGAWGGAN